MVEYYYKKYSVHTVTTYSEPRGDYRPSENIDGWWYYVTFVRSRDDIGHSTSEGFHYIGKPYYPSKNESVWYVNSTIQIGKVRISDIDRSENRTGYTGTFYPEERCDIISETKVKGYFIEEIIAEEGVYPINGILGGYWYVRGAKLFPELGLKINNSLKKSDIGWTKVSGKLKEIDKIYTKINGTLKEVE